jgi:hypothetical protein
MTSRTPVLFALVQAENWDFAGPIEVHQAGFSPTIIP